MSTTTNVTERYPGAAAALTRALRDAGIPARVVVGIPGDPGHVSVFSPPSDRPRQAHGDLFQRLCRQYLAIHYNDGQTGEHLVWAPMAPPSPQTRRRTPKEA